MNDVFIAFFEERDIIDLQYDKIRTLYRIVDTCQLSGLKVYISEEIINPIKQDNIDNIPVILKLMLGKRINTEPKTNPNIE